MCLSAAGSSRVNSVETLRFRYSLLFFNFLASFKRGEMRIYLFISSSQSVRRLKNAHLAGKALATAAAAVSLILRWRLKVFSVVVLERTAELDECSGEQKIKCLLVRAGERRWGIQLKGLRETSSSSLSLFGDQIANAQRQQRFVFCVSRILHFIFLSFFLSYDSIILSPFFFFSFYDRWTNPL